MKIPTLNRHYSREVDLRATSEYGLSSLVLMENAGRGVVDTLFERGITGQVVVCCGQGNNAGDGFVIARHLELRGQAVKVLLLGKHEHFTPDALANYQILAKTDVPILSFGPDLQRSKLNAELARADWIVDALLGTGARGEPRAPLDTAIEAMNEAGARLLAVDVPTGLDCDTGQAARHAIRAEHTCTFVAAKPGFQTPGAQTYTGAVHVLDIGAPRKLIQQVLREAALAQQTGPTSEMPS